ncbi:TlpA family protein disulfide reductase [Peptoanaerobacter stomatis]|uniref:TlpA family protein disulfide reductase n=1 Tax=Peptoanaerobacter stomatis TaxID=796937 RepID=UPI003F9F2EEC
MKKKTLGLLVGALVTTSVLAGYNAKGDNMASAKAAIMETKADKIKDDMMKDNPDKMMDGDMKKGKSDKKMKMKKKKAGKKMKKSDKMMKDNMKKDKSDKMIEDDNMMQDDMKNGKSCGKKKCKSDNKKNCKKNCKSNKMMQDDMKDSKSMKKDRMMNNKEMYDFTLKDLDGNDYKLSDNKGKKVYMKFWASWCSICLTGLEDLDKLAGENNDFEIVTVVAPGKNREMDTAAFKKWFKELGYKNLKVLFDETGEVTEHYGVKVYPTSVYVGSNGTNTTVKAGHNSNDDIKETIKKIK